MGLEEKEEREMEHSGSREVFFKKYTGYVLHSVLIVELTLPRSAAWCSRSLIELIPHQYFPENNENYIYKLYC